MNQPASILKSRKYQHVLQSKKEKKRKEKLSNCRRYILLCKIEAFIWETNEGIKCLIIYKMQSIYFYL